MQNKIRVVWVCKLSNPQIRQNLKFSQWTLWAIYRKITKQINYYDYAAWNTNAIREFEKFKDIELHVISPHLGITGIQHFYLNGVRYHIFQSEDDDMLSHIHSRITKKIKTSYSQNTKVILDIISQIHPDIIHYMGAEMPMYSESALSVSSGTPLLVSLQTLMCDPDFFKNYPISKEEYEYRKNVEVAIINKVDYIASKVMRFRQIINQQFGEKRYLDMRLAVGNSINDSYNSPKQYDFVYFAASISKAIDYALEAFARAKRKHKDITLHVVGGYDSALMTSITKQMDNLGISNNVDFTGKLPAFDDVIAEIRKARFALLPLKIDLVSGTIREAMANGLPVVTTITPSTPKFNENRESVLLSEKGDFDKMAENMCLLIEDESFSENLKNNALITIEKLHDNQSAMEEWRKNYFEILQER